MTSARKETKPTAARALLSKLIDYAGLFPPASLAMSEAVRNYAEYRASDYAWMLGRFIVPVSRLGEFEACSRSLLPGAAGPWRLSVLAGGNVAADAEAIIAFNARLSRAALIDAIEVKAAVPEEVRRLSGALPNGLEHFFEVPIDQRLQLSIRAIKAAGGQAKARAGGVTADLFPSAAGLADFIQNCRAEMVSFKVTAGLHHAVRGTYKLTYEEASGTARMHGHLNVFLAAAFLFAGMEKAEAQTLLEEQDGRAFRFDRSGIQWRRRRVGAEEVAAARRQLAAAFGSCSFTEPIHELQTLNCI